jgi:Flp pilus assembly protein TadG
MLRQSVEVEVTMLRNTSTSRGRERERGFTLIVMAVSAFALLGALGMSIDLGRMFIAKNEAQAYCDSAALAAALALDGTTAGIANAQAAVANSTNQWNFSTTHIGNPTVVFAITATGPWIANPNPATGYAYVRVVATVPLSLYFLPVVVGRTSQNVIAAATAGQVPITSFPRGLAPYTGVSTNLTPPNFGLVVGDSYDIQWPQFNDTRANCDAAHPDRCFVSPPCTGDSNDSKVAVVSNWGSSNSGYWGSTSNSIIEQEILDVIQLEAVAVGTNIQPVLTNGTKASEAGYLDERASQDINTSDNLVSNYLANPHNGRRLLAVPIVDPTSPTSTTVIGYGQFLLLANGPGTSNYYTRTNNGNDPFCAVYAGSFNVGSISPGTGGTTGATRVKLVQ